VAVAALMEAVRTESCAKRGYCLLNVTGGGEKRLLRHRKTYEWNPALSQRKLKKTEIEEMAMRSLKR